MGATNSDPSHSFPSGTTVSKDDTWIPTVCNICYNSCGIRVHTIGGVAVSIEGNPDNPVGAGKICAKGSAGLMQLYDPHRVRMPLKRTNPEKGIGIDPKWVEISWEQALQEVAEKLVAIRRTDPRQLLVVGWDIPAIQFYTAFCSAFGTPNFSMGSAGASCGSGVHQVLRLTHPAFMTEVDLVHCNYLIEMGTGYGFQTNLFPTTAANKMADARLRGMKLVVVDPILTYNASKADEWVPIRPGTDAALALSMASVMVNELGKFDSQFLKSYTNASYLIGPEGYYVRDRETKQPLVWDEADAVAKTYDDLATKSPALEGVFEVNGSSCIPSFSLIKQHLLKDYSPEKIEEITTVSAGTIRRLARELIDAAKIGSTITIEDKILPYRPATVLYYRGSTQHRHAFISTMAIELLNVLTGSIEVPGGSIGREAAGPSWRTIEGPDGILIVGTRRPGLNLPYPPRQVRPPDTLILDELFPVAMDTGIMFTEGLLRPEFYRLDYKAEALFLFRTNFLMTLGNPDRISEALRKVPFVVAFSTIIDETTEFADIVLPDVTYLERLDPFANSPGVYIPLGEGDWVVSLRQPVVKPMYDSRHYVQVLFDLAERAGFSDEMNSVLNSTLNLKEQLRLDPKEKYSYEEIVDRMYRNRFNDEKNLEWFKNNGLMKWKKPIEEVYPRPFMKGRIPIYMEFLKKAGEEVDKVTKELNIPWDTSDYQPIPDWKPCPSHEERTQSYDLYAIYAKLPFHSLTYTTQNAWLDELTRQKDYTTKILINTETARRKNICDGDEVVVESMYGYSVKGRVKTSEGVHPEVIAMFGMGGSWSRGKPKGRGKGVHFNRLLPVGIEGYDYVSAGQDTCVRVGITKA